MPSSEIMDDFRHGTLHSGKKVKGKKHKVVHKKKQAKAILLSYLRKEGKIGPRKNRTEAWETQGFRQGQRQEKEEARQEAPLQEEGCSKVTKPGEIFHLEWAHGFRYIYMAYVKRRYLTVEAAS